MGRTLRALALCLLPALTLGADIDRPGSARLELARELLARLGILPQGP